MSELSFNGLIGAIKSVDSHFCESAVRAVNVGLTLRNWCIGAYVAEFELYGEEKAKYGEKLFERISQSLKDLGMRRCDVRDLRRYVLFYERYPEIEKILPDSVREQYISVCSGAELKSGSEQNIEIQGIRETLSPEFRIPPEKLVTSLSFSHICEIIEIESPLKRLFYETECIKGTWSVRELKRQIDSMYFERSGLSKDKEALSVLANSGAEIQSPALVIRDPYIFDFLGLKSLDVMDESTFESAILNKLEEFLLELGHGFCFEARQKRILIGGEYFAVDLVFYHRILKCHVLVDLKMEGLSHAHIGQMNMYLNWYRENEMTAGDNPPVGIVLCPRKDEDIVHYATGGLSNEVFVSKYEAVLPDVEELERFVLNEANVLREAGVEYRTSGHCEYRSNRSE